MIPDLSQLLILDSLLREGSLTRTAELLGMSQPNVSRALAKLRRHFGDPLLVRSGQRMQPTARALELAGPVAAVLDAARQLEGGPAAFDPLSATRSFGLYMVDGAVVNILPQLLDGLARLENGAAGLQLRSVHIDPTSLETRPGGGRAFAGHRRAGDLAGLCRDARTDQAQSPSDQVLRERLPDAGPAGVALRHHRSARPCRRHGDALVRPVRGLPDLLDGDHGGAFLQGPAGG